MAFDKHHHSLLYPAASQKLTSIRQGVPHELDLALGPIVRALDYDRRHSRVISNVLTELNNDPLTISYRQDVLDDLLRLPRLAETIERVLPSLREFGETKPFQQADDLSPLLQVAARLAELEAYVACVEQLGTALDDASAALRAAGLIGLRDQLADLRAEHDYAQLQAELPKLHNQIERAGSITIGINLDAQLRPESATLVAVRAERFTGKHTLFERIVGKHTGVAALQGITALRRANSSRTSVANNELFQDLSHLLEHVVTPVATALNRYTRINADQLAPFESEFAFYLGAVKLVYSLRAAGLPLCRPEIVPKSEQVCIIECNYSLDLALRLYVVHAEATMDTLVTNDVCFDHDARLQLLTGPNSGGKTTYARAIGQAHVLFQAGLLVPGTTARISPVDGIFTHFATSERPERDGGRLSEELERLATLFSTASRDSLVLLNEPLTSTDHMSAHALATNILAGLRLLEARTLFVTHLYELVTDATTGQDHVGVVSLVAVAEPVAEKTAHRLTYIIKRGAPQPLYLAHALAQRYELSYTQIEQTLRNRKVAANQNSS